MSKVTPGVRQANTKPAFSAQANGVSERWSRSTSPKVWAPNMPTRSPAVS